MPHLSCILFFLLFVVVAISGVPLDYQETGVDSMLFPEDEVIFDRRDHVSAPPTPAIPEIPAIPGYDDYKGYEGYDGYEGYEEDHHSHHHHHHHHDKDDHDD